MCLSDVVAGPSPRAPEKGSMAKPLVIASVEVTCEDKRARNELNDSVTPIPKINLLRWHNHRDGALCLAVCSPHLSFDVAYQSRAAQSAIAQPNKKAFAEPLCLSTDCGHRRYQ